MRLARRVASLATCALFAASLMACARVPPRGPAAKVSAVRAEIVFASNLVRRSWGHRITLLEVAVTNVGSVPVRLSDWHATGQDIKNAQALPGTILPPSGTTYAGRTQAGVALTVTYDTEHFLPHRAEQALEPDASIDGLLEVEFPRQVNNGTVTISFSGNDGHKHTVGCLGCQMIP